MLNVFLRIISHLWANFFIWGFLLLRFWLIWHTCQWTYIIMIHDFITIWDHDLGGISVCGICVCLSWSEYWLQKLHILQVYHIMPPIKAHEIFSWYDVYYSTSSHIAQIPKVALLYIVKFRDLIFGSVMYLIWGYLEPRNCLSGLHSLKVMNF